jgi:diguanylate cyclase (GGDEF)-like protein
MRTVGQKRIHAVPLFPGCRGAWTLGCLAVLAAGAALVGQAPPESALDEAESLLLADPAKSASLADDHLKQLPPGDTVGRIRALLVLAEANVNLANPEAALRSSEQGITLAEGESPKAAIRFRAFKGTALGYLGNDQASIELLDRAVQEAEATGDLLLVAETRQARGHRRHTLSDFKGALQDLTEALRIRETMGSPIRRAEALSALALLYDGLGDYDKALEYYRLSLEVMEQYRQDQAIAAITFNIGRIYEGQDKFADAGTAYARSLEMSRKVGDESGVAYALHGLGVVDREEKRYQSAIERFRDSRREFERLKDRRMVMASLVEEGRVQKLLGRNTEALGSLEEALGLAGGDDYTRSLILREMAVLLKERGQEARAAECALECVRLREKVFDTEMRRQVEEARIQFDTKRKEDENAILAKENEIMRLKASREVTRRRLYATLAALVAALCGFLLYGLYRDRRSRLELQKLASTDPLTELYNRRRILELASGEFQRSLRYQVPLCVAVVDLDGLKEINDLNGHLAGDRALKGVADHFRKSLREMDHVGRVGGDEFLLLLPHTGLLGALAALQRLRDGLAGCWVPGLPDVKLTLSAGLAEIHPADASFEEFFKRADAALYQSKALGRNRVEVAKRPAEQ